MSQSVSRTNKNVSTYLSASCRDTTSRGTTSPSTHTLPLSTNPVATTVLSNSTNLSTQDDPTVRHSSGNPASYQTLRQSMRGIRLAKPYKSLYMKVSNSSRSPTLASYMANMEKCRTNSSLQQIEDSSRLTTSCAGVLQGGKSSNSSSQSTEVSDFYRSEIFCCKNLARTHCRE